VRAEESTVTASPRISNGQTDIQAGVDLCSPSTGSSTGIWPLDDISFFDSLQTLPMGCPCSHTSSWDVKETRPDYSLSRTLPGVIFLARNLRAEAMSPWGTKARPAYSLL
jgi:hypothetical protein